jgi:DNA-binding transcriptional LysR family regulator
MLMHPITFRRLEVFVAVAECEGFAPAAKRLDISQPTVSAHMAALEAQTGMALLQRSRGRKPTLTQAGTTFLSHARQLLAEAHAMDMNMADHRIRARRRVVFACQRTIANVLMPNILATLAARHPDIELVVRIGSQEDVGADLRNGIANVGRYLANSDMDGLPSVVVGRETLVFVASPNHPLARRTRLLPADLEGQAFVGPPDSSMFGRSIKALMADIGLHKTHMVSQVTEQQLLRTLVIAGVGLCCSLEKSVQPDIKAGLLVKLPVQGKSLTLEVRQAVSNIKPTSKSLRTFLNHISEEHVNV